MKKKNIRIIIDKAKYNRPEELSDVVNGALIPQNDGDES